MSDSRSQSEAPDGGSDPGRVPPGTGFRSSSSARAMPVCRRHWRCTSRRRDVVVAGRRRPGRRPGVLGGAGRGSRGRPRRPGWPPPTRLLAVAERFGCATFPTYDTGDHLELWTDEPSALPRLGPRRWPGIEEYLTRGRRHRRHGENHRPRQPSATKDLNGTGTARPRSRSSTAPSPTRTHGCVSPLAVEGVWTVEPRDILLFDLLFYVASAGGFRPADGDRECRSGKAFRVRGAIGGARHRRSPRRPRPLEHSVRHVEQLDDRVIVEDRPRIRLSRRPRHRGGLAGRSGADPIHA